MSWVRASSGNASSTTVAGSTPRTNRRQRASGEAARSYQDSKKPSAVTSPAQNNGPSIVNDSYEKEIMVWGR